MTTYAAVNSLVIMKSYSSIHRDALYSLFLSLKNADGSFSVHLNGCDGDVLTCVLERATVAVVTVCCRCVAC